MIARLKNLGWWLLGLTLLLFSAFAGGKRQSVKQAQQEHRSDIAERETTAAKLVVDAAKVRQDVEDETTRRGPDAARKNLKDRWTQP